MIEQWVQYCDLSTDQPTTPALEQAIEIFNAFPWLEQLKQLRHLNEENEDNCPPCVGFDSPDNATLNISSYLDDQYEINFEIPNHEKFMGFIPKPPKSIVHRHQSKDTVIFAIKLFYDNQYEALLQPLKP